MNKKYNRYQSIILLKCPQCGKGDLFTKKGLVVYNKMIDMPENCPFCGLKYQMEPGFWIGALWTSYPIVVLVELPFLLLALFNQTIGPWIPLGLMFLAFFLTYPIMLRLGRSIWISIWVKYDKNSINNNHHN